MAASFSLPLLQVPLRQTSLVADRAEDTESRKYAADPPYPRHPGPHHHDAPAFRNYQLKACTRRVLHLSFMFCFRCKKGHMCWKTGSRSFPRLLSRSGSFRDLLKSQALLPSAATLSKGWLLLQNCSPFPLHLLQTHISCPPHSSTNNLIFLPQLIQ